MHKPWGLSFFTLCEKKIGFIQFELLSQNNQINNLNLSAVTMGQDFATRNNFHEVCPRVMADVMISKEEEEKRRLRGGQFLKSLLILFPSFLALI